MSVSHCPGCQTQVEGVICCDSCWARVPTNLPNQPRWRSRLRGARRGGGYGWTIAAEIHGAVKAWLTDHQLT